MNTVKPLQEYQEDRLARQIVSNSNVDGKPPQGSEDALARQIAGRVPRDLHALHSNELLSRDEAARYLGVASATLAGWASTGSQAIPVAKIGGLAKYRKSDLDAFIARRTSCAV